MPAMKVTNRKALTTATRAHKLRDLPPIAVSPGIGQTMLEKKYAQMGGERFFGAMVDKGAHAWLCERGAVVLNPSGKKAFEIHGDIYKKWRELGGVRFGRPDTDETATPDGVGRYNHFNRGTASIYWTPKTGANAIWGDIRKLWARLGYERSYLGYPTTDELPFDGGRANAFQNGGIYWWPDTGAIDLKGVIVHYTGLYCFQEGSDNSANPFDNSVEPYVIMSAITPRTAETYRSKVYDDVDSKESRPDLLEIYRGDPFGGLGISITLMERDEGDPDKYKDAIHKVVMKNHEIGTVALGFIPVVGPLLAAVLGPLLGKMWPGVASGINSLLDTGDDVIQQTAITINPRQLVLLAARTKNSTFHDIGFKTSVEVSGRSGQGGRYGLYFGVVPM